jgi:hypothetical protein
MNRHRLAALRSGLLCSAVLFGAALPLAAVAQQAAPAAAPPQTPSPAAPPPSPDHGRPAAAATPKAAAQDEAGEPRAGATQQPAAVDRVQLDATTVTGNQELPKVMYIVPWKKSDAGDVSGKPVNSLLDEILEPVDRDVFRREVTYYQAVKADAPDKNAAPPKEGEK